MTAERVFDFAVDGTGNLCNAGQERAHGAPGRLKLMSGSISACLTGAQTISCLPLPLNRREVLTRFNRGYRHYGLALKPLAIAVIVIIMMPSLSWSRGRLGNRASAMLGESRLTTAAQEAIRDLLESGETLADISTWAHQQREIPRTGPWLLDSVVGLRPNPVKAS